jgi:hypothetical protein
MEGRQLAEQKEAEEAAVAAEQAKASGITIEIPQRQPRDRGAQPQRGERRERGGRGRGDRDRGRGDRRPKKTAPGTIQPVISGVPPSSVEAVETVEAVIAPAEATEAPAPAAPVEAPVTQPVAESPAPPPAPVDEKAPAQDASAA